jgi:hypothetical protein
MSHWYSSKDLVKVFSISLSVIEFCIVCFFIKRSNLAFSTTHISTLELESIPL